MDATSTLPSPMAVRELLEGLLGRDVTVAPSEPVATGPKNPIAVAVYVDDRNRMTSLAVADLPFAAYSGAAIGLVPVGGAEAAIEDGELASSVADNYAEVVNILSSLFNVEGAPHVRLYAFYPPGETPPTDVAAVVRTIGHRLDQSVKVAGYGSGRLSLVLAP